MLYGHSDVACAQLARAVFRRGVLEGGRVYHGRAPAAVPMPLLWSMCQSIFAWVRDSERMGLKLDNPSLKFNLYTCQCLAGPLGQQPTKKAKQEQTKAQTRERTKEASRKDRGELAGCRGNDPEVAVAATPEEVITTCMPYMCTCIIQLFISHLIVWRPFYYVIGGGGYEWLLNLVEAAEVLQLG